MYVGPEINPIDTPLVISDIQLIKPWRVRQTIHPAVMPVYHLCQIRQLTAGLANAIHVPLMGTLALQLTHWGLNEMVVILQTIFSSTFY